MLWLKRNAILVFGALGALVLLGVASTYSIQEYRIDRQYSADLAQLTQALQQLLSYEPRPSQENIAILKANIRTLKKFMADSEEMFISVAPPPRTTPEFKIHLLRFISDLSRDATNANVAIPPRYAFTFGEVVPESQLPDYVIAPLSVQLDEIKVLCAILFDAKIHGLESIQRVPTQIDKAGNMDCLRDDQVQTNAFSISVPYRLSFRCFTAELSGVLNGLAQSPHFIVVKTAEVQSLDGSQAPPPAMPPGMMMPPPGAPGAPPVPAVPKAPVPGAPKAMPGKGVAPGPPKSSLVTVLDERPLKVSLLVHFIKPYKGPKPAAPGKAAPVRPPAPVGAPGN